MNQFEILICLRVGGEGSQIYLKNQQIEMETPKILRPVQLYFRYTERLKENNPLIAYSCLFYAVQEGFAIIKASGKDKDAQRYLVGRLEELQQFKANLGVKSKEEAKKKVQDFCIQLFVKINKSEMVDAEITKKHALEFNRTAHFIKTLKAFDALNEDWEEKQKYCQVKAVQINKDLRQGITPKRGNPFEETEEVKGEDPEQQQIPVHNSVGFNDPEDEGEPDPSEQPPPPPPQESKQSTSSRPSIPKAKPEPMPQSFNSRASLSQSTVAIGKVSSSSMGKVSPKSRAKIKLEAKKFGDNGCQELEFDNIKQAVYCFEKALEQLKKIC